MKIYQYDGCDSCRKALKFLDRHKVEYERIAIVDRPPSRAELARMLKDHLGGQLKKLFNVSGQAYREGKLGEKLGSMAEAEALGLLAANGKLVKRPFVLGKRGAREVGLVGFDEKKWKDVLGL